MSLKAAITLIAAAVPFFLLTVWALVDALTKDFGSPGRKAVWALVAAVPFVGAPIYLAFGFRRGRKPAAFDD
jgi:hypothetical protein